MAEETKKVYRSVDTLFNNSQCLFIEYHDVMAMPWFTLLSMLKYNENIQEIFDLDEIESYGIGGLLEWYVYRPYRNIFMNFPVNVEIVEDPDEFNYDAFLAKCIGTTRQFYEIDTNLKFVSALDILLESPGMVKSIIFYTEYEEPALREYIKDTYGEGAKIKYFYGDFKNMLSLIPNDSTYILSDIEKVNVLVETGKINLSCILLPAGLRYNYEEDDSTKLKVDMKELLNTYVFKYNFFDNFDMGGETLKNSTVAQTLNFLNMMSQETSEEGEEDEEDFIPDDYESAMYYGKEYRFNSDDNLDDDSLNYEDE